MAIKPGSTPTIRIKHNLDMSLVAKVELLIKQYRDPDAASLVKKTYPGDVSESGGVLMLPLTAAETGKMQRNKEVYIDPRVTCNDGIILGAPIIRLQVTDTLWGDDDD